MAEVSSQVCCLLLKAFPVRLKLCRGRRVVVCCRSRCLCGRVLGIAFATFFVTLFLFGCLHKCTAVAVQPRVSRVSRGRSSSELGANPRTERAKWSRPVWVRKPNRARAKPGHQPKNRRAPTKELVFVFRSLFGGRCLSVRSQTLESCRILVGGYME